MRGRIMGKAGRKVLEVSTDKRFSGFIQSGRTVAQNYEVSFQKTNSVSPLPLYPGYNCCEAADTQWRNKETVTKISLLSFYFIWIFFSFYLLLLHCQVWETSCLTMKNNTKTNKQTKLNIQFHLKTASLPEADKTRTQSFVYFLFSCLLFWHPCLNG